MQIASPSDAWLLEPETQKNALSSHIVYDDVCTHPALSGWRIYPVYFDVVRVEFSPGDDAYVTM